MRSEESQWEWAQRILELQLGKNPHGAPLYRFVWGEDRLEWVGGKWEDRDSNTGSLLREIVEQRQVPKYSHLGAECWYVERWYPAEHFGTQADWESKVIEREGGTSVPARGPYPAKGDYDFAWRMEGPDGEFRPLTFARVEWISSVLVDAESRSAVQRSLLQKAVSQFAKEAQKEIDLAVLEEATPAFHGQLRRGTGIVVP